MLYRMLNLAYLLLLGLQLDSALGLSLSNSFDQAHIARRSTHGHAARNNAHAQPCFPSLGFQPLNPDDGAPSTSRTKWWCSPETENGFFGFTYGSDDCQGLSTLTSDFSLMRSQYNARYVRLYSWCDGNAETYLNNVVNAAYSVGLGVYFTIWFGFDGDDKWKGRKDLIVNIIQNNPLAPYVIRSVDVGSEPLYDWVLDPQSLANQIKKVQKLTHPYGVNVSISEMEYGYSVQGDSQMVLDVEDVVHAHELPFFDNDATDGSSAFPSVQNSTEWFVQQTYGTRKIIFSQTGWPTNTNTWQPNSPNAVASVESAQAYAQLLDDNCETLKSLTPHGGVGWFWHIWKDEMLDGWGLLDWNDQPKWDFAPRTAC